MNAATKKIFNSDFWGKHPNAETVNALIAAGADVNSSTKSGWSPMHVAAACGSGASVKALIKAGANVNAMTGSGITPLQMARQYGSEEAVKALIKAGAA